MDLASPDSSSGNPEKIMESPFGDQSGERRSKSSTKITHGLSFVASRFSTWRMSDTTRCRKPRVPEIYHREKNRKYTEKSAARSACATGQSEDLFIYKGNIRVYPSRNNRVSIP